METQKIEEYSKRLLDLGKRNRLINYRDSAAGSAEAIWPDAQTLFAKITASDSVTYEAYNSRSDESDPEEENDPSREEKRLSKEEYLARYKPRLKRSQLLFFSEKAFPWVALRNIAKKQKELLEETGVNSVYLAFGFVHWKENSESSKEPFCAPLLLIPVTLKSDSVLSPFSLSTEGDDVVVNPTFNFKMQNEYGVSLPEYEDGTSLFDYLDLAKKVITPLNWEITPECKIGNFSFLKINMYHDLQENAEKIMENENVRKMLGETVASDSFANQDSEPIQRDRNPVIDLHNVVDADSSQIEAIEWAKTGKSFVLQGPPGTGKSQTITNIIAESLYAQKKVLFVSEKQAALNVVFEKLKRAGLEEFCLELHSHKANKKEVIKQLNDSLEKRKLFLRQDVEREIEKKAEYQKKLDRYAEKLHAKQPEIRLSLYQLIEKYSYYRKSPDISYSIPLLAKKDEDSLDETALLLQQYVEYLPTVGHDYRKYAWYGYRSRSTSTEEAEEIREKMESALRACQQILTASGESASRYGIPIRTFEAATTAAALFSILKDSEILSSSCFLPDKGRLLCSSLKKMAPIAKECSALLETIKKQYETDILEINGKDLHRTLEREFSNPLSRLLRSPYKAISARLSDLKKSGKKIKYKEALQITETLSRYQALSQEYENLEKEISPFAGPLYQGLSSDWAKLESQTLAAEKGLQLAIEKDGLARVSFEEEKPHFAELAKTLEESSAVLSSSFPQIKSLFDPSVFGGEAGDLGAIAAKLESCLREIDRIGLWNNFRRILDKLEAKKEDSYLIFAIDNNLKNTDIVPAFQKAFYRQWIDKIIQSDPLFLNFHRIEQDQIVKEFAEKDKTQFRINRDKIKEVLSQNRPSLDTVVQGSPVAILRREGEKKRQQRPIRKLFDEIGDLVQTLKPCFLMSPLSISTFLSANGPTFDLVIFDEASQIFPQDALGAIYRGKQLIVVGDSKQMPPSNFFNATIESSESQNADEEWDEDLSNFESVLDLCKASFPQRRLNWHYRSKCEQLIVFSNKNFYNNSLLTFPSAYENREGFGVDYYFANGIFEHKKATNRKEAEFVVDLIFQHIQKYPHRSLGVVAFSKSQQDLIEQLRRKRLIEDPSKEEFFRFWEENEKQEPFFVKNLETVQGDERDTIIFSIAYAKDALGRFQRNFGPLNRSGGERRLNVAVSRAKFNIQIVASIHAYDIDLKGISSEGAKLLREYLDFAENGTNALLRSVSVEEKDRFDSCFEEEVHDFLEEKGFSVDTQVGCSGYRIDLALKKPNSSQYLLAIECDGASYHSSQNARDRDRLRQEILESMGWKFYRIWSTDWFKNKRTEQERLLEKCTAALSGASDPGVPNVPSDQEIERKLKALSQVVSDDLEEKEDTALFPPYITAPDLFFKMNGDFVENVKRILSIEAPLSVDLLLKRILPFFHREKITSAVREEFAKRMRGAQAKGIIIRNGFLYRLDQTDYTLRRPTEDFKREPKDIAPEELAAGISVLVKENGFAPKYSVFSALNAQLGFARQGAAIHDLFENALKLAYDVVESDDGTLAVRKTGTTR